MKAFTDQQALDLGRAILNRFEEGLNGNKWMGSTVVLPIKLTLDRYKPIEFPRETAWCSAVTLSIPYFFRRTGPNYEQNIHITLDEWLDENSHG